MSKAYLSLYYSYREQLALLSDEERGRLVLHLIDYANAGVIPELDGAAKMAFAFIKSQIDRDSEQYESRCQKNRENISKRWGANDTIEYDGIRPYTKHTKEKEKEKKKESIEPPAADTPTKKKFCPPSVENVRAYCQERKNQIDPAAFCDYYAARGWKLNGEPMEDWKATVRTWERHERQQNGTENSPPEPHQRVKWVTDENGNRVMQYAD